MLKMRSALKTLSFFFQRCLVLAVEVVMLWSVDGSLADDDDGSLGGRRGVVCSDDGSLTGG